MGDDVGLCVALLGGAMVANHRAVAGSLGCAWFINPLAWQLLFFAGVALAARPRHLPVVPRQRGLIWLAVGGLALALLLKVGYTAMSQPSFFDDLYANLFGGQLNRLPMRQQQFPLTLKRTLGPLRLLHFFLLAYVCWALAPRAASFWKRHWVRPVLLCGRHSLPVFCFGVLAGYVARGVLLTVGGTLAWQAAANLAGWTIILGFGCAVHFVKGALASRHHASPATFKETGPPSGYISSVPRSLNVVPDQ